MARRSLLVLFVSLVIPACTAPASDARGPEEHSAPEAARLEAVAKLAVEGVAPLARVLESREIAATHVAEIGDRLVTGEMLLVDARPPAGTDHAQYFLLDQPLTTPPTDVSQLYASNMRTILLGGVDGSRPAVFRDVAAGTYTVCAVVGPPASAGDAAELARLEAIYRMAHGDKFDAEKPEPSDPGASSLRCARADVTADAGSRVVVLDQA